MIPREIDLRGMVTSCRSTLEGWCVALTVESHIMLITPLQLEEGSARLLIHKFDVKKRAFFGNTSMEAEISLLMANQTLVSPAIRSTAPPISSATGLVREADV